MKCNHLVLCLCLLILADFRLAAKDTSTIPLPFGNFEGMDIKTAKRQNRFGCFTFHDQAWKITGKDHAASGKHALELDGTMDIDLALPPEHRGKALQLSFMGKGTASFTTQFLVHQTDQTGESLPQHTISLPIIADIAPKTRCAAYRPINLYTSIPTPQSPRVTIRINQTAGKLLIDDLTVTAHETPFHLQGNPLPLPPSLYSLPQGKWIGSDKDKVNLIKKGDITILQLWHGPTVTLNLPLESLRDKWLAVAITARGHSHVDVKLLTGAAGQAATTLHAPSRLGPDPTVIHAWFCPAGPLADDLKLQVHPHNLAEITDIKLFASDTPLIPHTFTSYDIRAGRLPDDYLVGRRPPHPNLVNVAPYADLINRQRYVLRRTETVDGVLGSGTSLPLEFRFNKPVDVAEIRLTMPYSDILLMADTQGKGIYDTQIVRHQSPLKIYKSEHLRDYVWYRKTLDRPLRLYGIMYRPGGFGRLTYEFQILATPQSAAALIPPAPPALPGPILSSGKALPLPAVVEQDRLRFGFTLDASMIDVPHLMRKYYRSPSSPIPPIAAWKQWGDRMERLKAIHANALMLAPAGTFVMPPQAKAWPGAKDPFPLLWKSKVWYLNQPHELLKMMTNDCRKRGITVYVTNRDGLYKKDVKDGPLELAKEITQAGAHGTPICLDEQSYYLKDLATDTLSARKDYLNILRKNADLMRNIKRECRKINPLVETFGTFSRFYVNKYRLIAVSPHDAWGFEGQVDLMGGAAADFTLHTIPFGSLAPAVGCKELASLSPGRRTLVTQHANPWPCWDENQQTYFHALAYDDYPSVAIHGGILTTFFNKAETMICWRYSVMMNNPMLRKAVTQTGKMVRILSAWGGKQAGIPKDVMVLRSRTGEDWWSLHIKAPTRKAIGFDQNLRRENHIKRDAIRGTIQFNWCITQLLTHDIPHELYLLNRPSAWKNAIRNYKVVILPFTYAISQEAVREITSAAKAGVRIMALTGGALGSVDDLGEPHPEGPLLEKLVAEGLIQLVKVDVLNDSSSNHTDKAFNDMLIKTLNQRGGVSVTLRKPQHRDIQCYMLERSAREKLVLLVNYSDQDTAVTLELNLPTGTYRTEICKTDSLTEGRLGDKTKCSAKELRNLNILLPREATQMLRIYPVND